MTGKKIPLRQCIGCQEMKNKKEMIRVIKTADHIIDLGPEGGDGGGNIVITGTPEEVAACEASYTGQYLKKMLRG